LDNYPETHNRLDKIEQAISDLQEKMEDIIRKISELEERVTPAVDAQRIRDNWDGY
jgi:peptidoglycan hydrolase CwlO-like protein